MDRPEGEIKFEELLDGYYFQSLPLDHQANGLRLHWALNFMRKRSGIVWKVTSAYRSIEKHTEIYARKNALRKTKGLPPVRIPWGSFHLIFAAADISDMRGEIKTWVLENIEILERLDIYCENPDETSPDEGARPEDRWIHFQIFAPQSGKRFFEP